MDADLDLLIAVYVTADDLLPEKPKNARRSVTDAEVVTPFGAKQRGLSMATTAGSCSATSPSTLATSNPPCSAISRRSSTTATSKALRVPPTSTTSHAGTAHESTDAAPAAGDELEPTGAPASCA